MWVGRRSKRYFYRSRRVGGRPVKEYVGPDGPLAEAAAAEDEQRRRQRGAEGRERRAEADQVAAAEGPLGELSDELDLLARAVLVAAGFHQHDRGEWRLRRAHNRDGREDDGHDGGDA